MPIKAEHLHVFLGALSSLDLRRALNGNTSSHPPLVTKQSVGVRELKRVSSFKKESATPSHKIHLIIFYKNKMNIFD